MNFHVIQKKWGWYRNNFFNSYRKKNLRNKISIDEISHGTVGGIALTVILCLWLCGEGMEWGVKELSLPWVPSSWTHYTLLVLRNWISWSNKEILKYNDLNNLEYYFLQRSLGWLEPLLHQDLLLSCVPPSPGTWSLSQWRKTGHLHLYLLLCKEKSQSGSSGGIISSLCM